MNLTVKQYDLLIDMFNASIERASKSRIPIGKEYYEDLDIIKNELYSERTKEIRSNYLKEVEEVKHDLDR